VGASTNTVDSNISGLAFAQETLGSPGVLSTGPWFGLDPNSYKDFGAAVKMTKRETINAARQMRKSIVSGIDVKPGFQLDMLSSNMYAILQGFMFAAWREKPTFSNGPGSVNPAVSSVSSTQYTVASLGAGVLTTHIIFAQGFGVAGNNGLKFPSASSATTITASGLATEASPPTTARINVVGFQGASADLALTVSGGIPTLGSTVLDLTTMGMIPGEWVWIGGDTTGTKFATAASNGFYRVTSIATHAIVFDRFPIGMAADTGTGVTLQVFFGQVIKNEALPANQKFYTYSIERQLNATNVETMLGCGGNKLDFNIKMNDKVTVELDFMGLTTAETTSANAGTRVGINLAETVYSTATDFPRLRIIDDTSGVDLATYVTDIKLAIDNKISIDNAIRNQLGGIDLTAGDFMVSASVEVYFSSFAAVTAIKANDNVGLDFAMVRNVGTSAVGWLLDVPYLTVGDAKAKVEKDKPVKLPLTTEASAHPVYNHTMLAVKFNYLPQAAL